MAKCTAPSSKQLKVDLAAAAVKSLDGNTNPVCKLFWL